MICCQREGDIEGKCVNHVKEVAQFQEVFKLFPH